MLMGALRPMQLRQYATDAQHSVVMTCSHAANVISFRLVLTQVLEMVAEAQSAGGAVAVQMLAKIGRHLPEAVLKAPAKLQAAVPHLTEAAERGPPQATKAAVRYSLTCASCSCVKGSVNHVLTCMSSLHAEGRHAFSLWWGGWVLLTGSLSGPGHGPIMTHVLEEESMC